MVNELNAVLGTPHTVVCGDETFSMSLIKERIRDEFQAGLFDLAKRYVLSMREMVDEDEYRVMLKDLRQEFLSGQYAIDGKQGIEFIQTQAGIIMLIGLLLGVSVEKAKELMINYTDELKSALDVVIVQSMPPVPKQSPKVMARTKKTNPGRK